MRGRRGATGLYRRTVWPTVLAWAMLPMNSKTGWHGRWCRAPGRPGSSSPGPSLPGRSPLASRRSVLVAELTKLAGKLGADEAGAADDDDFHILVFPASPPFEHARWFAHPTQSLSPHDVHPQDRHFSDRAAGRHGGLDGDAHDGFGGWRGDVFGVSAAAGTSTFAWAWVCVSTGSCHGTDPGHGTGGRAAGSGRAADDAGFAVATGLFFSIFA